MQGTNQSQGCTSEWWGWAAVHLHRLNVSRLCNTSGYRFRKSSGNVEISIVDLGNLLYLHRPHEEVDGISTAASCRTQGLKYDGRFHMPACQHPGGRRATVIRGARTCRMVKPSAASSVSCESQTACRPECTSSPSAAGPPSPAVSFLTFAACRYRRPPEAAVKPMIASRVC
jgi:hypothetical protein